MNYFFENIQFLAKHHETEPKDFELSTGMMLNLIYQGAIEPTTGELIKISEYYNFPVDVLLKQDIKAKFEIKEKDIKFLILDVDGVMTDGGMFYTEGGDEFKKFNAKDGMAIKKLTAKNFPVGIISSGFNSNIINNRAKLLGIEYVYVGTEPKINILEKWCEELGFSFQDVAFLGDDINDKEIMEKAGLSACPANAVKIIKDTADIILKRKGGDACIREFIDEWLS